MLVTNMWHAREGKRVAKLPNASVSVDAALMWVWPWCLGIVAFLDLEFLPPFTSRLWPHSKIKVQAQGVNPEAYFCESQVPTLLLLQSGGYI